MPGRPCQYPYQQGLSLGSGRWFSGVMTTDKKTWFITGARPRHGRRLRQGRAECRPQRRRDWTQPRRRQERRRRVGRPARRQARRHQPAGRRDGDEGGRGSLRRHRRAGQQHRQPLRGLLRGADPRADGRPARREPHRPDERHQRRPARHSQAALRTRRDDLVDRRARRLRVRDRIRHVEVRRGRLDGVAGPRDRAVRHPHDDRQPRVLPHRAADQGVDQLRRAVGSRSTPSATAPSASSWRA